MTDLEKFVDLYRGFGINLPSPRKQILMDDNMVRREVLEIELRQGEHPKFGGYFEFLSTVEFDLNGKFLCQNFWE